MAQRSAIASYKGQHFAAALSCDTLLISATNTSTARADRSDSRISFGTMVNEPHVLMTDAFCFLLIDKSPYSKLSQDIQAEPLRYADDYLCANWLRTRFEARQLRLVQPDSLGEIGLR